jgi:hypothetical protein
MHLTYTVVVESCDDGGGKIHESCQKRACLSVQDVFFLSSTGCLSFCVSFITNLKSNLCTVMTTQNTTERHRTISHAQNTSTSTKYIFKWNTSVTGHKRKVVGFAQCKLLSRLWFQVSPAKYHVDENWALLVYYAASMVIYYRRYRGNLPVSSPWDW